MKTSPLVLLIALAILPFPAFADDVSSTATPSATPFGSPSATKKATSPVVSPSTTAPAAAKSLAEALVEPRKLIAAKNYAAAITALKKVDLAFPRNADVNNLLGYSSRNLGLNDDATKFYASALKINPNHLGALEYQGVLFIKTNKLTSAKINLSKLKKLCGVSCEEYKDLLKAIPAK